MRERDGKEEKALPVSHWTYPQLKHSQNRDYRVYTFLKICSCHSAFLICNSIPKFYSRLNLCAEIVTIEICPRSVTTPIPCVSVHTAPACSVEEGPDVGLGS